MQPDGTGRFKKQEDSGQHAPKFSVELEAVLDIIQDPIIELDPGGQVSGSNKAVIDFLGFDPHGLTRQQLYDQTGAPAAIQEKIEAVISRVEQDKVVQKEPVLISDSIGQEMMLNITVLPFFDPTSDRLFRLILTWHHDTLDEQTKQTQAGLGNKNKRASRTTERLLEQHQHELHQKFLEAVLKADPSGVAVVAQERNQLRFRLANAAYRSFTPHPEIDPVGQLVDTIWPEAEGFSGEILYKPVFENGKPVYYDREVRHYPDGAMRSFTIHARPLTWEGKQGALLVVWETTSNLAAQQMAEQAAVQAQNQARKAQEERDRLTSLINNIQDEVWFCDAHGMIELVNLAAAKNLGYESIEDLLNPVKQVSNDLEVYNPDGTIREVAEAPLLLTLKGQPLRGEELVRNKKTGEFSHREYNTAPIRSNSGQVTGAVAVTRDITRHKRTEAELALKAQQLEQANHELEDFAFVASHDLQEPLRKVKAFTDLILLRYSDSIDQAGRDYMNRMQSAVQRMQEMIEGLLTFSRVTTQADPFSTVDLNQICQAVISDLEIQISRTGGQIEVGPLPLVEADPLQMRQLLQNLISNALKYHQKTTAPEVQVWAEIYPGEGQETGRVQLMVKDNGIGFDERFLDRIFKPFQRLHGAAEYVGTGMGLPICQKIVERHGGTITANSSVGQGSTFIVTLPLRPAENRGKE